MLNKTKTANGQEVTAGVGGAQPATATVSGHYFGRSAQFLAILMQFALVVVVIAYWKLDSQLLWRVMWLGFAGFIIHHFLTPRFRLPFFAMLSLLAVISGVGHAGPNVLMGWLSGRMTLNGFLYHLFPGLTLIGIGLGLIGLCHLPIRFAARVGLIAIAGAGLAFLPAHSQRFPDV